MTISIRRSLPTLLFPAGLQAIPGELYETAVIGGASAFQICSRVILPVMPPILSTVVVREGLSSCP
ncbi:MAG: hypothetical protein ACI4O7_07495 [Aristaeellaceae bacterium]